MNFKVGDLVIAGYVDSPHKQIGRIVKVRNHDSWLIKWPYHIEFANGEVNTFKHEEIKHIDGLHYLKRRHNL